MTEPGAKALVRPEAIADILGCIPFHTDAARRVGASKEEMFEALGVAVALNAGAALVDSAGAFNAFTRDAG